MMRAMAGRSETLLRLWLAGSAILLAVLAVWAFAPVLVFMALLAAALGALSLAMIGLARGLKAWRSRRGGHHPPGPSDGRAGS